jgi:hypothetical protein
VGGDKELFEQFRPALETIGKKIFLMGPIGSAAVIKVITNMLAFIHLVADGDVWMHLGHPEYAPVRITFEWQRDRAAGRADVAAPRGFDPEGVTPTTPWDHDARDFFRAWTDTFAGRRDAVEAA